MQPSRYVALASLLVAVLGWSGAAFGEDPLEERRVTIDVRDAPLYEVAALIGREADIDIILHKDVRDELITLTLTYRPVTVALEAIARAHDLKLERLDGDEIFFIRRPDGKADSDRRVTRVDATPSAGGPAMPMSPTVRIPSGATQGSPIRDPRLASAGGERPVIRQPTSRPHLSTGSAPVAQRERVKSQRAVIPCRYVKASDVASWFGQPSLDYGLDGRQRRYRAPLNLPWARVDLGDTINRHDGFLNLAKGERYAIDPTQYLSAARVAARDQGPFGDEAGLGGDVGGGGGGLGGQGGAVFELPEGIDELVGYDLISALIVRGDHEAIDELRELVELLDLPPQQIEVEARFVTLSVSDADSLGISWTVTDGTSVITGSTPGQGGASVAFRTATGNFQALITSIVRNNKGKVVNAPKVATQNGQPAIVAFQQTIPVTISDTVITDASQTVSTTIQTVPVTTSLLVVPRVTGQPPNESITTVVSPQVADVIGFVDNPSGGTIPIVASQIISTMLRVRNGETIALGGLVRKNNSASSTKIPLLGDLPFIGQLFRSKTRNLDESELLIFVTPTIMRELFLGGGPNAVG